MGPRGYFPLPTPHRIRTGAPGVQVRGFLRVCTSCAKLARWYTPSESACTLEAWSESQRGVGGGKYPRVSWAVLDSLDLIHELWAVLGRYKEAPYFGAHYYNAETRVVSASNCRVPQNKVPLLRPGSAHGPHVPSETIRKRPWDLVDISPSHTPQDSNRRPQGTSTAILEGVYHRANLARWYTPRESACLYLGAVRIPVWEGEISTRSHGRSG
ncbi:hypothetical protein Scep_022831 [Stephania cephalantha]|uniref:Uncharacterized protein n=1 Tax=Stephania cephalantha TaxID=152367 RepID=A0AAP0I183_9MAGN